MTTSVDLGSQAAGWLLRSWRRAARFTQKDIAQLLRISLRSVWGMEHGTRKPKTTELQVLERELDLGDEQRTLLWGLAAHRPPPSLTKRSTTVEETIKGFIELCPFPAILADANWDTLAANTAAFEVYEWLGDLSEVNLLLHCLIDPAGRAALLDWEEQWAAPLIAQLRLASARSPDDPRLAELREAVLGDDEEVDADTRSVLRRQWDRPEGHRLWVAPTVWVRLTAIAQTPVRLAICTLTTEQPGLRLYMTRPLLDEAPD